MKRGMSSILAVVVGVGGIGWGWHHLAWRARTDPQQQQTARAALDRRLPVVRLTDEPLDQAIPELARLAGVRIDVDWDALASEYVSHDRWVTVHAYNRPLDETLRAMFSRFQPLNVSIVDRRDHILIETLAQTLQRPVLCSYDVSDLLRGGVLDDIVDGPSFNHASVVPGAQTPSNDPPAVRRRRRLIQFLDSGLVRVVGDHLCVLASTSSQAAVADALRTLRAGGPKPDWPGDAGNDGESFQELLARRAPGHIRTDAERLDLALDRIRETFRANIAPAGPSPFSDAPPVVTLCLSRPTLQEALEQWAQQVWGLDRQIRLIPDGEDAVAITWQEDRRTEADYLDHRTYDLRALIPRDPGGRTFDEFITRLESEVAPDSWKGRDREPGMVTQTFERRALIVQSRANHRLIRRWLDARLAERAQQRPAPLP
jgi:hypothetical protein